MAISGGKRMRKLINLPLNDSEMVAINYLHQGGDRRGRAAVRRSSEGKGEVGGGPPINQNTL